VQKNKFKIAFIKQVRKY